MQLPDEPKGWRALQLMAQRETDPQKLASIIDKMNRLLDGCERVAARNEGAGRTRRVLLSDPAYPES